MVFMDKRILIVDDDQGFGDLLKGVFEHAGYTVHLCLNAEAALELLETVTVDLLVTDQRLPGLLNGTDLIGKFREKGLDTPVIVISGYLDNEAIRGLIRDGVVGVFIKPLNIFSLLKKASEVLEERARAPQPGKGVSEPGEVPTSSEGAIGEIAGLSEKGKRFVERAREAASFKRNLLLIGPRGTLFEQIGRDIVASAGGSGRCLTLQPGDAGTEDLEGLLRDKYEGQSVTVIILQAENWSGEAIARIMDLMDNHGGAHGDLRMIFGLNETVEDLYDSGKIDEEFYLFLGTNELRVPALREMPEDLLGIVRRELSEQFKAFAGFDMRLRSLLLEHDWPENLLELKAVLVRAMNKAHPMPPSARHFKAAFEAGGEAPEAEEADYRSSLERFLLEEKARYLGALNLLENS